MAAGAELVDPEDPEFDDPEPDPLLEDEPVDEDPDESLADELLDEDPDEELLGEPLDDEPPDEELEPGPPLPPERESVR